MNAMSVNDAENARRREDMLRELNLHPLWRLRDAPVQGNAQEAVAAVPADLSAIATLPEKVVVAEKPPADISHLTWSQLKKQVQGCNACKLRAACLQTVFGTGDESADWLFVGSWPSEDDEAKGEPFAGPAGQLLDNMLAAIRLKRSENVYLANVVKCSGSIVRGPQADEIAQCAPFLSRQIQLLQPKIIVALGHAAATALLGADSEWASLLGTVHHYAALAKDGSARVIPLIITHHPAALLLAPLNKAQAWKDLCLARDTMQPGN